jgi:hypothetical protein
LKYLQIIRYSFLGATGRQGNIMAKVKRNPAIGPLSGKIKNLHYADYGDKQVVRGGYERKPTTKWTEPQVQSQGKFEKATAYAKQVLADPARKAEYREASKTRHRSEWNLAIADARKPPAIIDVDVSGYCGRPGDRIVVAAVDDTKVAGVSLVIKTAAGALIEQGSAALDARSPNWIYVAQATIPESEVAVAVEVAAVDLPGNRVQKQVDRIVRHARD